MRITTIALAAMLLFASCAGPADPPADPVEPDESVEEPDDAEEADPMPTDPDADPREPDPAEDEPEPRDEEEPGDEPDTPDLALPDERLRAPLEGAIADVAADLGIEEDAIEVIAVESVTWRDGALGCPEPDGMYTQALVDGYRIVLRADGEALHYHGAWDQPPFRCDDPQEPAPGG